MLGRRSDRGHDMDDAFDLGDSFDVTPTD